MKHARSDALDTIDDMLEQLRGIDGLVEKSRGVFYRSRQPFLHFHEDPAGMFADVRFVDEWERREVTTKGQQRALIAAVRSAARVGPPRTARRTECAPSP